MLSLGCVSGNNSLEKAVDFISTVNRAKKLNLTINSEILTNYEDIKYYLATQEKDSLTNTMVYVSRYFDTLNRCVNFIENRYKYKEIISLLRKNGYKQYNYNHEKSYFIYDSRFWIHTKKSEKKLALVAKSYIKNKTNFKASIPVLDSDIAYYVKKIIENENLDWEAMSMRFFSKIPPSRKINRDIKNYIVDIALLEESYNASIKPDSKIKIVLKLFKRKPHYFVTPIKKKLRKNDITNLQLKKILKENIVPKLWMVGNLNKNVAGVVFDVHFKLPDMDTDDYESSIVSAFALASNIIGSYKKYRVYFSKEDILVYSKHRNPTDGIDKLIIKSKVFYKNGVYHFEYVTGHGLVFNIID